MSAGLGSLDATGQPGGERSRVTRLAMTGLAFTLSSPALLHELKGHSHNLVLLTELLQRETADGQDAALLRASAHQRAKTIRSEIEALRERLRMLESLSGGPRARERTPRRKVGIRSRVDRSCPTKRGVLDFVTRRLSGDRLAPLALMSKPTLLARLTKRLDLIGAGLLAAAAVGFVWAVGFTRGVQALVDTLVIAGVGLLVPGLAVLWVSWIIGSATGEDRYSEEHPARSARERWTLELRNYAVALLCVAVAAGTRELLSPYLLQQAPYPTFFLAVTVAAWVGGMGPAVFATALSVPATWALFSPSQPTLSHPTGDLVAAGLFVAVALAIGGITAALRLAQTRATALGDELASRQAALDEGEARFRDLADRSNKMLWIADATGHRTFFNRAWQGFTGSESERLFAERWVEALHARDRERCLAQQRKALDAREPFTLHYRLRRHDDEYRSCVDNGRPRFFADGRLAGFIGECVDVTDISQPLRALTGADPTASERSVR